MQPYYELKIRKVTNDCSYNNHDKERLLRGYRLQLSREIEARNAYFHDYLVPALMVNYDNGRLVDDEERSEILAWATTVEPPLALRHLKGFIQMIRWVGIEKDGRLILENRHQRLDIDLDYVLE